MTSVPVRHVLLARKLPWQKTQILPWDEHEEDFGFGTYIFHSRSSGPDLTPKYYVKYLSSILLTLQIIALTSSFVHYISSIRTNAPRNLSVSYFAEERLGGSDCTFPGPIEQRLQLEAPDLESQAAFPSSSATASRPPLTPTTWSRNYR